MRHMMARNVGMGLVLGLVLMACAPVSGGSGSSTPAASAPEDSGVEGRIVVGPSCPVEGLRTECPPGWTGSVQADVQVLRLTQPTRGAGAGDGGTVVAVGHSDVGGRFRVSLAPGAYVVRAVPPAGTTYTATPVAVTVSPGRFTEVTLALDTGIR
jgi:hypothetical protein